MAAAAAAADGMHVPNYRRRLDDINQGVGGEWVMADNIILINGEHRNGMVNALSRTRVGATHGQRFHFLLPQVGLSAVTMMLVKHPSSLRPYEFKAVQAYKVRDESMFSLPAHMPLPAGVTVEELQLCCDVPSMLAPQEADAHQERTLYDLPDYYTTSPYFETPQVFAVCYQHLHAGAALHKAGIAYGGLQGSVTVVRKVSEIALGSSYPITMTPAVGLLAHASEVWQGWATHGDPSEVLACTFSQNCLLRLTSPTSTNWWLPAGRRGGSASASAESTDSLDATQSVFQVVMQQAVQTLPPDPDNEQEVQDPAAAITAEVGAIMGMGGGGADHIVMQQLISGTLQGLGLADAHNSLNIFMQELGGAVQGVAKMMAPYMTTELRFDADQFWLGRLVQALQQQHRAVATSILAHLNRAHHGQHPEQVLGPLVYGQQPQELQQQPDLLQLARSLILAGLFELLEWVEPDPDPQPVQQEEGPAGAAAAGGGGVAAAAAAGPPVQQGHFVSRPADEAQLMEWLGVAQTVVDGAVLRWFAANMPLEDIAFQLRTGSGLRLHLVHEASGQDVQALGEEQLLQLETLSLDWWVRLLLGPAGLAVLDTLLPVALVPAAVTKVVLLGRLVGGDQDAWEALARMLGWGLFPCAERRLTMEQLAFHYFWGLAPGISWSGVDTNIVNNPQWVDFTVLKTALDRSFRVVGVATDGLVGGILEEAHAVNLAPAPDVALALRNVLIKRPPYPRPPLPIRKPELYEAVYALLAWLLPRYLPLPGGDVLVPRDPAAASVLGLRTLTDRVYAFVEEQLPAVADVQQEAQLVLRVRGLVRRLLPQLVIPQPPQALGQ